MQVVAFQKKKGKKYFGPAVNTLAVRWGILIRSPLPDTIKTKQNKIKQSKTKQAI